MNQSKIFDEATSSPTFLHVTDGFFFASMENLLLSF